MEAGAAVWVRDAGPDTWITGQVLTKVSKCIIVYHSHEYVTYGDRDVQAPKSFYELDKKTERGERGAVEGEIVIIISTIIISLRIQTPVDDQYELQIELDRGGRATFR